MPTYFPKRIEPKWQKYWLENKTFRCEDGSEKPKYYLLDMFPYPSGAGLHVGHPEGYTATDILARYKRMNGFNVLHPIGWDAFGLPAEQYAVQTGTHPRETTAQNIANFRRQIQMLGFSYDWDREIDTTDPGYYKWTQWIFLQLFDTWYDAEADKGRPIAELPIPDGVKAAGDDAVREYVDDHRLAYCAEVPVNWCPELGTVLANEEVINGRSERGDHPVVRMPLRQWMLRITAYAERLLDDLDTVDWPDPIKKMQREWIGRSEGAEVDFPVITDEERLESWFDERESSGYPRKPADDVIRVYTTRPDTLYGATYMVLSPEHPLVEKITTDGQLAEVNDYVKQAATKSDLDRTDLAKEKTGVFTGAFALNPVNQEPIPIWIADYVLMGYGTGAIMAVPAHDTRDFEFATQFGLDVVDVVVDPDATPRILMQVHKWLGEWERRPGAAEDDAYLDVALILNAGFDLESFKSDLEDNAHDPMWAEVNWFYDPEEGKGLAVSFLDEGFPEILNEYIESDEETQIFVFSLDPSFNLDDDEVDEEIETEQVLDEEDLEVYDLEDEELPAPFVGEGLSVDSGIITGLPTAEAKATITNWLAERGLGRKTVNYKLRDWLFSRQRYWGEPFPILLDGEKHVAVDKSDLPVLLPQVADFKPTGSPDPPLSKAPEEWSKVVVDGTEYRRETNTMPQWAGSCWYFLRYLDPNNDVQAWAEEKEKYWMPVDLYVGGAEHAVLHLLYSRFWHKVLYDRGHVHTSEPFKRLINQGMILGEMEFVAFREGDQWVSAGDIEDRDGQRICKMTGSPVEVVSVDADQVEKRGTEWVLTDDQNISVDARAYKMSKARGNVINPDDVVDQYGADSLRLYEMFMGPLEATKPWSMSGVDGVWRFLNRVWRIIIDERAEDNALVEAVSGDPPERDKLRALHQTIKGVTEDIEALRMNTAISKLMEFTNFLTPLKKRSRQLVEPLVILVSPFAPHIAEEMWQALGHEKTLANEPWPTYDPELLKADEYEVAIQINNKMKGKITAAADLSDDELIAQATSEERIQSLLEGKNVIKSFVVSSRKGKLINFVVKG